MSDSNSVVDRLRGKELNPILLLPVVVIVVLVTLYFTWLRPKMIADEAMRNFNTPEAQAKRDPDQRKTTPEYDSAVQKIREKFGTPPPSMSGNASVHTVTSRRGRE